MKSPWQIGLLALAVTGVAAYDFLCFKKSPSKSQTSIQISTSQPAVAAVAPVLSVLSEPAESRNAAGFAGVDSLPHISREELHQLSQQAFVSREFPKAESDIAWPRRDPFELYRESREMPRNISAKSLMKETPAPPPLSAPQCVFSGTLIDGERKLALVDGVPLSIGARLGVWQLARIEPDFIILQGGKETHRIELKGMQSQDTRRKDPL
jgi:hypothetical protein